MSKGKQLRELMARDGMVLAPGAYDGLTAKLIQQADFSSVYMTGGGTSSGFGYPDYGLLTMSEMVENAGRIADAVDLPVISDADNGYGNELNVFVPFVPSRRPVSPAFISRIKYSRNGAVISMIRSWSRLTTTWRKFARRRMRARMMIS